MWTRVGIVFGACAVLVAAVVVAGPQDPDAPAERRKQLARADWFDAACGLPMEYLTRIRRGLYPGRSPEIAMVPREPNFFGSFTGTTHSGPWQYLQEVPLVLYGPGYIREQGDVRLQREVTVADLAPTLAELAGTPFPGDRPGRVLHEALLPEAERDVPPAVVVVVVWDGGGWNVLDATRGSWDFLDRMMEGGTSLRGAIVGSSPSVTPAIHTTIGTGTFPSSHGIVSIRQRKQGAMDYAYGGDDPQNLEVEALGDIHDRATGNRALVGMFAEQNWMLGMIGHGAYLEGADHDHAIMLTPDGRLRTNPEFYSLSAYLHDVPGFDEAVREVDLADGKLDQRWMGIETLDEVDEMLKTPVWIIYQTEIMKALFAREGYGRDDVTDLFFVNYKQMDHLGHLFNMLGPEVEEATRYTDDALEELATFLDDEVGRGRWVIAMTADHGQSPDPQVVDAWPIDSAELPRDMARFFEVKPSDLIEEQRPNGYWIDRQTLSDAGIELTDIARFILTYTLEENAVPDIPTDYRERADERLFQAAFPSDRIGDVIACARER